MQVKQKGSFTVELALVLVFASGIFLAVVNYMLAVNQKGQLDRATYSLTTILAERKQLFSDDLDVCAGNCNRTKNTLFSIASSSLRRMTPTFDKTKFGMRIDEIRLTERTLPNGQIKYTRHHKRLEKGNVIGCNFPDMEDITEERANELLPVTSRKRRLPMYQVSLCYEIPFNLLGVTSGEVNHIISTSYSFARI
ncbi:tight adherence pilus pseudopilin TadF [Vibrio sp. TRT 21S02]|uniref:tight adherence pilus pseudopilin TadF n=1 Tax=Vibrio sp. TRT 21S02 TaxID=3418507 RepID=UPI003CE70093